MFDSVIEKLKQSKNKTNNVSLGFDGYVDEIIEAVGSRKDISSYTEISTISEFGQRILNAAGKSTNIELVTNQFKLGGNGPILGNSLAKLGENINYIGALGYPEMLEVFKDLPDNFKATTISNPGHTMALEFDDGKIMFGRLALTEITFDFLKEKIEEKKLQDFFYNIDLLGLVNWTQTPYMSEIFDELITNFLKKCPKPSKKPFLFVDLADPQKRDKNDIIYMLKKLNELEEYYNVILGLNEKESYEIANVLNIDYKKETSDNLMELASNLLEKINISICVIHPVKFAVCASSNGSFYYEGPYTPNPLISTGAGDNFNAGFVYGIINGLDLKESLLLGTANSGFYVRNAKSGNLNDIVDFINDWKNNNI